MKVSAIANKGARERCDWSFVLIVWMDSGCVEIVRLLVTNTDKTGEQTHYGHYTRGSISIILCSPPLLEGFSGV